MCLLSKDLRALTHLWMHRLLSGVVLAPEPPVHKDPPELHVEDDGVASEEADFLLQQSSLLSPRHLMTLKPLQLQTSTLGLQTQTLVLLLRKGSGRREIKTLGRHLIRKLLHKNTFYSVFVVQLTVSTLYVNYASCHCFSSFWMSFMGAYWFERNAT